MSGPSPRCGDLPAAADVVVVGGGISGQACAASAAARGASVVLVEKEPVPAFEGSGRAQGSLRVQGRAAAELPLAREALELWRRTGADADIELSFDGNVYLCDDPAELPMLRSLVRTARESGLMDVELLDRERARRVLPAAKGPFAAAMWSPYDGQCDPGKATRWFAGLAKDRGARQLYGVRALRVLERTGRVVGVATDRGVVRASALVIAAGVWTPHIARTAGLKVPVMPLVVSQCETTPSTARLGPTIRAFGFGCRQRPDGRIVLSSGLDTTVEHRLTLAALSDLRTWVPRLRRNRRSVRLRPDLPTTLRQLRRRSAFSTDLIGVGVEPPPCNRAAMERALHRMHTVLPGTRDARIARAWSGLIDLSPDGLPIVDGGAGRGGLVLVTGLSGHGLALGPVLGEIGADLAVAGATARPIEPFRLARFHDERVPVPERMI